MTMSAASADLTDSRSVTPARPGPAASRQYLVRPAPRREPPFDDELPERHLSLVGPLDQPLPLEDFGADAPPARPTLPDPVEAQPTGRHELPEPALMARRLVIGVVEIATGRRSASQLRHHTSPAVQAGLVRDAGRITRLGTVHRPATLHSLHVTEPADGVAEVAAVLRIENRFRALALRLEGLDGRWRCVRLQIG